MTGSTMDRRYKGKCLVFLSDEHSSLSWSSNLLMSLKTPLCNLHALTTTRYTAPLLFPLLDSFPKSMFEVGSGNTEKLAVHAGLTTSTAVAGQIRTLEPIIKRMINIEEREALSNGLQVLAEEYDEGWDSGSDSDDDE